MMLKCLQETDEVYEGQFSPFTITRRDRLEVAVYRGALTVAALAFALGSGLALWSPTPMHLGITIPALFAIFCTAMGISLWTIHIYLKPLHRALQILWAVGCLTALWVAATQSTPLPLVLYQPFAPELVGVGLIFVALTGLFVKEAFCFNHWETKVLTFLVPLLLLSHWLGGLPQIFEQALLGSWALLFVWFAVHKDVQPIPPDIGDKSVFVYLAQQKSAPST